MYAITRADLPPAQQAVQCAHALVDLVLRFAPAHETLVMLAAPDSGALHELLREHGDRPHTAFCEPDLDGELTAVAFTGKPSRAVRRLPLILQGEVRMSLLSRKPASTAGQAIMESTIEQLVKEKALLERQLNDARARLGEHREVWDENRALQQLLDGQVPEAASWLMAKVARQRKALDAMNRKAVSRRLVLRAFTEAGYRLSPQQWAQVREWFATGRPGWAERLPEDPPTGTEDQ